MKTTARSVAIVLLTLLAVACQSPPGLQYTRYAKTMENVNNRISDAHDAGIINDETLLEAAPFIDTGNTAVQAMWDELQWDEESQQWTTGPGWDPAKLALKSALLTLQQYAAREAE